MIDTLVQPKLGRYDVMDMEIKDYEENAARTAGVGSFNKDGNRMLIHMRKNLKFFLTFFFIFFILFLTAFVFISTSGLL